MSEPRRLVVKVGGGAGVDVGAVLADVAEHARQGDHVVLVHGGGPEIDRVSAELGVEPRHLTSTSGFRSRHTDAAALDALLLALRGRVSPALVAGLGELGVRAVGLTGLDGGLARARRKAALTAVDPSGRVRVVRDDRSGAITGVDPTLLLVLLGAGYVPVVSPPAAGGADGPLSVDADRLAAALAGAIGAAAAVFLSDVPGLLRDPADPHSLIARVQADDEAALSAAAGRMRLKVLAAREALAAGVRRVVIADGRRQRPVRAALAGQGTVVEAASGALSR